ncbi:MAG TPA: Npt1/Npt2 family nucleotide transporter [Blastocatellia bacterium]|nr:Npt1/Npt2 family nucleotide transporter [Blastocatellia bacterium]
MSDARPPSALDRFLGIFGDVRAGEGTTVLLMSLNIFLLLVGYYVLKTVREPLILMAGGAELKSYAAAAQALTLIAYVPIYGWVASRLPRQRFLMAVILFFVGCIQFFFLGSRLGVPHLGFIFFVWVGIFSLTTIAQFWSYANEIYAQADGHRLFPLIAVGSAAGAPLGAALAGRLFALELSPFVMMQIAAGILLLHLALYKVVSRRVAAGGAPAQAPMKAGNGFALVLKSHYLRLIALFLVLLNIVNTVGEYILGQAVVTTGDGRLAADPSFNKEAFIGTFYGKYFFWTNIATILIQAFLVSRIVKRFGMRGVLLALPIVALGAYGLAAVGAGLAMLLYVKIAENSTDYSVMNTGKQMVWLPTTREEKYKAKQAIDTFFVRSGDMLAAGVVFLGTEHLKFGVAGFAGTNIAVVLIAIGVAVLLLREYRRLTSTSPAEPSVQRAAS